MTSNKITFTREKDCEIDTFLKNKFSKILIYLIIHFTDDNQCFSMKKKIFFLSHHRNKEK